ncbi:MAG: hypothetical protein Q8L48_01995 [Archangium sp.]|nr:hypothetical protein [Archangium sp.]
MLAALGCSGTGSGCSTLTPYPAGTRYMGPKNDNAINIRLSASGINYLNSNWQTLIGAFAPGGTLGLPIGCMAQNIAVVGDVLIADQGGAGCNAEGCGQMDGVCDNKDVPANVQVQLTGFSLAPRAPDLLDATIQLSINTGNLYVDTADRSHGACAWLSPAKCSITFNTAAAAPADNRLRATVKFTIDTRFDKLLAFNVQGFSGTEICGASGASPKPQCLDPADLSFNGRNNCGDVYCGIADWDPLKQIVLQLISAPLQTQIRNAIGGQTCWPCMSNTDCPRTTDGTNTASTCDSGTKVCMSGATCVPRFLGVEGTMSMGALLGSFGAPADAQMELSLAAGASVVMDQGMSFGTRVGIQPTTISACVPPQAAPPMTMVAFPDFDGEATPNSGYHVGLGISSNFLNAAFWSAQQSGALCLNLSSDNVGLINTGLFKTFLPSLGKLATRDGKDAPMMVVLRPARPPTVVVGEGTYDPVTKKPIKPLLMITLPDLSIDFYAMLDDRYARLFTLTADISLPISLIFEGCDKVTPALGDLRSLITNIRTGNAEILAEDPQVLADLVPAVIGLAEPALAGGLSGFALPALGSFKLKVNEVKGLGRIAGSEAYNHLGLYAQLLPLNGMCAFSAPQVSASLKASRMPKAEDMRLQGRALPWPEAVLDVRTLGTSGSAEFSFKIDDGLWTDFRPVEGHELLVSHPRFLLQGQHVIHVRARIAEDPHAISASRDVGFKVDWEAPEITLTADPTTDRLLVSARDVLSADRLEFAYRVGEGEASAFGAPREISLSAVEQQGGVTVLVRDEFGNVGQATYRPPQVALRDDVADTLDPSQQPAGCSTTGGLELLALGALALLRRRKS